MSEITETSYCTKCKTNRPLSLFSHPSRANPYKTCSICRSRSHPSRQAVLDIQLLRASKARRRSIPNQSAPFEVQSDNNNSINNIQLNDTENSGSAEIDNNTNQINIESTEVQQIRLNRPEEQSDIYLSTIQFIYLTLNLGQLNDSSLHDNNQRVIERIDGPIPHINNEENYTINRIHRRLPPWQLPLPSNRPVPAGFFSRYKKEMSIHYLGSRSSICPSCKALHWIQERVQSSTIANPRFQTCCKEGQVVLDAIPEPPELLRRLWTSNEADAKAFRRDSHLYNRAFAFTSFNYTPDKRLNEQGIRGGIRSFSIHGQIYHQTGGALREGAVPSYAQVYFLDGNEAVNSRSTRFNLNPRIVSDLTAMMETINPFVNFYRTAQESLNDSNLEGEQRVVITPQFRLVREEGTDRRRYNLPTVSEFAVVIPDEVDSDQRDVILYQRNGDGTLSNKFQYIHRSHPAYLPLHYVLFYPYGNPGYRWSIKLSKPNQRVLGDENHVGDEQESSERGCVSARLFYRYHIFSRFDPIASSVKFNALIHGGRLFQQLCCDMYACIDDDVLQWHRLNQDTIRADLYSGVIDALRSEYDVQSIGKPVILAASYLGGDRHMTQCYQNAMAIVRAIGKPSYFITFTANPSWQEILENLEHNQSPDTRPDLIAFTFKAKLDALLYDLKERIFSGNIVSAHLPIDDAELASIVKSQLTHGPCGPEFPNSPCMRDGKCSKGFPKRWCESTIMAENSYPEYARPNTGETWGNDRFEFDNRWVVPYNAFLTRKYKAHINVEVANGIQAIKYLAKYIYKGSDRASLVVDGQYDEISMTVQGRYIGPVQAVWRLMGYTTHEEKPPVMLMPIHCEGRHRVSFHKEMSPDQVVLAAQSQSSAFIDWMKYNAANADGRDLLYSEFPGYYTYNKKRGWQKRKK
ncbi:hypothetical protein EPUL_004937, partial [Erysiphe pulchra]